MFNYETFRASFRGLVIEPTPEIFSELDELYSEETRFYHDRSHVAECLANFGMYRHLAKNPAEIEVAIWFHDAIYDTRKGDNEELSAQLAQDRLTSLGANERSVDSVVEMILATKTHNAVTPDSKLMLDVDLGILGASKETFERYDESIRREFEWVPEEIYLRERAKVLRSFLEREQIYQTKELRDALERRARENLARKISQLAPNE